MRIRPTILLPSLLLAALSIYIIMNRLGGRNPASETPSIVRQAAESPGKARQNNNDPLGDARKLTERLSREAASADQKIAAIMQKYDASKLAGDGLSTMMKPFILKYEDALRSWGIPQEQHKPIVEKLIEYERQVAMSSVQSLQRLPSAATDPDEYQETKDAWVQQWQSENKERRQSLVAGLGDEIGKDRALTLLRIRDSVEVEVRNAMPTRMAEMKRRLAELKASEELGTADD